LTGGRPAFGLAFRFSGVVPIYRCVSTVSAAVHPGGGRSDVRGESPAVPGYVTLGELGRGADTVVYRVRRGDADWAMKVRLGFGRVDDDDLAPFRREAALLALANHPTLPRVHEVGTTEGRPYLVMDLIAGRPLASVLRLGPLPEDEVRRVGAQVGEALAAAHRVGLVHRDLKPDNIMLQPDGQARLIDFGLAAMTAEHATDTVVGTLAYAAPEQSGTLKRVVDSRSDLYSLGVVLFECATGRPPFVSTDVGELLRMHASVPAPDVRTLRPGLSAGVAEVITTLLAKDPDDRYDSAGALLADLGRLTDHPGEVVAARRSVPGRPVYRAALTGRDRELGKLVAHWRDARAGRGKVVVVRGDLGSGKTRMMGELIARVEEDGFPALYAPADDEAPLAPLRRAIEQYIAHVDQMPPAAGADARAQLLAAAGSAGKHVSALSPVLAGLLSTTDSPGPAVLGGSGDADRSEGLDDFIPAIAGFLLAWARGRGGVLICIDDAERLDGATARVLAQLTATARETPLLIVAGIDGGDVDPSEERAFQVGTVDLTVTLQPLHDAATNQLINALGGGMKFDHELLGQLATRSGRTPLEITEYLAAVIDAGLLSPAWGNWVLDVAGLDGMSLPSDMLGLITRRIDATSQPTQELLSLAAVIGQRFDRDIVARLAVPDHADAGALLDEAVEHGVLLAHGAGYAFTHEWSRAALLDRMDPGLLRTLHQRVAIDLDTNQPAERFAVARHYLHGRPEDTPDRATQAFLDAAELAIARHAGEEAVEFLEHALTLAGDDGSGLAHIRGLLADAYAMAGRLTDNVTLLETSLAAATDPLERARILTRIAGARKTVWDMNGTLSASMQGMAEAGGALPGNRLLLALSTICSYLAGKFVQITGLGFGDISDEQRARFEVRANLSHIAEEAAIRDSRPVMSLVLTLRGLYPTARLGPSQPYLSYCGGRVIVAEVLKVPGKGRWLARAERAATIVGTPEAHATVRFMSEVARSLSGRANEAALLHAMADIGHLLPVADYLDCINFSCVYLVARGRTREARTWYDRAIARLCAADLPGHHMELAALATAAGLGRVAETDLRVRHITTEGSIFTQPMMRVNTLSTLAAVAVEQRELGDRFGQVAADFAALKTHPSVLLGPQRLIYATLAYGMLERCRVVPADHRPAALADAEQAVAALRRMPGGQIITAHLLVTTADLRLVSGDPHGALTALTAADTHLKNHDVPRAAYEAARVRARAYTELGRLPEATGHAHYAISLAEHYGWPHRSNWIRAEFGLPTTAAPSTDLAASGSVKINETGSLSTYGRRLAALEQLSLAASRIVDPRELTRIALDQTLEILAAERAFLFLTDGDDDTRLVPHLGRDAAGNDIDTLTEYGSTLVERVRADRQPIVVTGTDEGAALGSKSAVAHGLRSIIVAPLLLDARLIGVVYLDSRIAKGMFTTADVGTLTAITTHIAAALETARAAQLGSAIQAAHQRLKTAETMRQAISDLAATLDPNEVLTRLHATLARVLPADASHLYLLSDNQLTPSPEPANTNATVPSTSLPVTAGGELDHLLHNAQTTNDTKTAHVLGLDASTTTSCLAIALRTRETVVGLLILTTTHPDAYTAADIELATALAAQGMIAYDNARLFAEVRHLAVTDGLTGVYNRRHFFTLAAAALNDAIQHDAALSAVMLDIDHFKRVNDTYGHPVGDQVIKTVATRLAQMTRDDDLVARYGGEEFALILTQPADGATHVAERIRAAIADTPIDTDAGPIPITISVGIAHRGQDDTNAGTLLGRADIALYQAKEEGRNCVVVGSVKFRCN
jgi:diguanylate cyclase (GGDEF)-like protein